MRFLLLLCLTLGTARAEIPLELVAEFQLPPGTGAWDVQHWMDDSTFGWVAAAGRDFSYQTRLGGATQSYQFSDTICGSNTYANGNATIYGICALKNAQDSIGIGIYIYHYDDESGYYRSHWIYSTPGEENFCRPAPGYIDDRRSEYYDVNEFYQLPELPAIGTRVICSMTGHGEFDGPGPNVAHALCNAYVWQPDMLANPVGSECISMLRPFYSDLNESLGGSGYSRTRFIDDDYPFDPDIVVSSRCLSYMSDAALEAVQICEDADSSLGALSCGYTLVLSTTAMSRNGNPLIIQSNAVYDGSAFIPVAICFDAETRERVWQQPDIAPSFTVCRNADEGQLAIEIRGDRFYAYSVNDGALLDSSVQFPGELKKVFKTGRCESEIITKQGDTIRAYKLVFPPRELTISIAPIGGQVILRWNPLPTASYFRVCRNIDFCDDLCENGEVYTTTDTTMVLTPWAGATQEFYRVTPVFE